MQGEGWSCAVMVRKLEGTEKRSEPRASSSYVMEKQKCSMQDGKVKEQSGHRSFPVLLGPDSSWCRVAAGVGDRNRAGFLRTAPGLNPLSSPHSYHVQTSSAHP